MGMLQDNCVLLGGTEIETDIRIIPFPLFYVSFPQG